ncbi:MAG: tetratricopeptide repeat protein, partial [Verrucomicrobiae bacterium]|nr:tetratricopeptide repeat protein [Verrucomicrobiae bacterium]
KTEQAVALYDDFFPDFAGTFYEPQVSVYTLEALEKVGRAEDGLTQLEKMIVVLGSREMANQDLDLLRRCIGSYSEASVRNRGAEKTLETLGNFPGLDPNNQALMTWLKMQKVIVLQTMRSELKKDAPEYAALTTRIDQEFREMEQFEVKQLSEIALKMIGDYLSNSDNPFLGVRYYEELLVRENPDADKLKASADLGLGRLEARRPDKAAQNSARDRFRRVIEKYGDKALEPDAWLELGRVDMALERWADAKEAFAKINQNKKWLTAVERAESNYNYGVCLEKVGDLGGALQAYNAVWVTATKYVEWSSQAFEKVMILGFQDIEANNTDPIVIRAKKIEYYELLKLKMFQWQQFEETDALRRLKRRLPEMRDELGITVEEEKAIDFKLGLDQVAPAPAK